VRFHFRWNRRAFLSARALFESIPRTSLASHPLESCFARTCKHANGPPSAQKKSAPAGADSSPRHY
jgi:hypothetical protein